MIVRNILPEEKKRYNAKVSHPVQSWEWGDFKAKTGVKVVRLGAFQDQRMKAVYQISFHSVPKLQFSVGYFPKGPLPDKHMLRALSEAGKKNKAVFIKLEPNVKKEDEKGVIDILSKDFDLRIAKPIFAPYTFWIDLTRNEEELLAAMKPKTRYNIGLAQRNGVTISEDNSKFVFETYLRMTQETARRQGFYAHGEEYHRKMWEFLHPAGIAHLLVARWKDKILTTWVVFVYNKRLYYPYGASSSEHRNLMANNLMMWEAMRFGKKMGCHSFDLWGALGPDPDPNDPWYGFHRFKEGYGGELIEFMGAYDLVLLPQMYSLFSVADNLRWKLLRLAAKFR